MISCLSKILFCHKKDSLSLRFRSKISKQAGKHRLNLVSCRTKYIFKGSRWLSATLALRQWEKVTRADNQWKTFSFLLLFFLLYFLHAFRSFEGVALRAIRELWVMSQWVIQWLRVGFTAGLQCDASTSNCETHSERKGGTVSRFFQSTRATRAALSTHVRVESSEHGGQKKKVGFNHCSHFLLHTLSALILSVHF